MIKLLGLISSSKVIYSFIFGLIKGYAYSFFEYVCQFHVLSQSS